MMADDQPIQDSKDLKLPSSTPQDDEESPIPEHKSGVRIDPDALDQSSRFGKRDTVHMSLIERGVRTKGTFTVLKGRLHKSKAFYEYQLADPNGKPYKNGEWVREKDLRLDKRE